MVTEFANIWRKRLSGSSFAKDEKGSTIPFYLAFFITMLVFLAIAVDLAGAMLLHESRTNDLAEIRDAVESDTHAMIIKNAGNDASSNLNSNNPGCYIANMVNSRLRAKGFTGEVTIYFYELAKDELPDDKQESRRLYAWVAVAKENYNPPFGIQYKMDPIVVQSTIASTGMPYSGGTTYRPDMSLSSNSRPIYNGKYVIGNGVNDFHFYQNRQLRSNSFWPQSLKNAVDNRLAIIAAEPK